MIMSDFKLTGWRNERPTVWKMCWNRYFKLLQVIDDKLMIALASSYIRHVYIKLASLDLCVPAVAQKVDLLSGVGGFYNYITACRRKTRDRLVLHAVPLNSDFLVLPVFFQSFYPDSPTSWVFFTLPCLISGMSPEMSKPYGRTGGGRAGGGHKSKQHG